MPANLTRRRLATLAATPFLAATQAAPANVQAQDAAAEDDLAIQRANLKRWREQMNQVKLARDVELVCTFKA